MRDFKIGDKVKIPSKPDSEWDCWELEMHEQCGDVLEVREIIKDFEDSGTCIELENDYIYRPSYLLTEPYNQSEQPMEIDNMNKLSEEQIEILKELKFDTLEVSFVEGIIMGALAGTNFETPKPKTRTLTHFEILKMDAVFKSTQYDAVFNSWNSYFEREIHEYCLKSDFQKAQSLDDVVWKPLTTEEP